MSTKVLIAYASRFGSTTEIAQKIGQVLQQAGFVVDVLPAAKVTAISNYQAVILGSAVYAGQWRKEAVSFLEANEAALSHMPVWFFSTGPTGEGDPVQLMKGWRFPEAQKAIAQRINPRDTVLFHGWLDFKKLSFGEKLLIKGIKAPIGDFRDWAAIVAWAKNVAETLKQPEPQLH